MKNLLVLCRRGKTFFRNFFRAKNYKSHLLRHRMNKLIPSIEQLMRDVGSYLLGAQEGVKTEWKGVKDPVTEADRESERRLKVGLEAILPDAEFRGEESGWSQWKGLSWVVDPIDGTSSFIAKREGWCILVALVDENVPVLACTYFPNSGDFYHAIKNEGAFKNGEKIHVSEHVGLIGARTHTSTAAEQVLADKGAHEVLHCRAAGLASALVADGTLDAYLHITAHYRIKEWDVAAGMLLVEEAGGKVSTFAGKTIPLNQETPEVPDCVFSNGLFHEELTALYDDEYEKDL